MKGPSLLTKHWQHRTIISYILYPFSLLFCLAVILRRLMYKHLLHTYQAPVPSISIGNLVLGGSGKTPFTIYLAGFLQGLGYKTAVSHRGYKSALEDHSTLISDRSGLLPIADQAGDEAWLLACKLPGVPVVAGKNRQAAIELLCSNYPDLDCIILDDSYQHLRVKHDLDFIIISEAVQFGNGFVLPAGLLREPPGAMSDTDALVINRRADSGELDAILTRRLAKTGKPVFSGFCRNEELYDFAGNKVEPARIKGRKVLLVAALANPSEFVNSAGKLGIDISGMSLFSDHFSYANSSDRQNILHKAEIAGARWVLTTEKDYAKLRHYPEFASYLLILPISFVIDGEEDKLADLLTHAIGNSRSGI